MIASFQFCIVDLHAFAEAMHMDPANDPGAAGWHGWGSEDDHHNHHGSKHELTDDKEVNGDLRTDKPIDDDDDGGFFGPPVLGGDEDDEFRGKSLSGMPGIIGLERCHIYEKIESGMSVYLSMSQNQSHDCVLRAICEAQLLADFYLDAPSSIFFEVIHLILK